MIVSTNGACGLHWRYEFNSPFGRGEGHATRVFHPTRGWTARVSYFHSSGNEDDAFAFLDTVEQRARSEGLRALYVSTSPDQRELAFAAQTREYSRLSELVMSRAPYSADRDDLIVRKMLPGEYADVRSRVMSLVSHGRYVASDVDLLSVNWELYRPFVAEMGETIVGYAENNVHFLPRRTKPGYATLMRVERVAVVPEMRGFGLGGLLVARLIRDADEHGCERVDLQVDAGNPAAIRTYDKLGFVPTDGLLFAKTIG